MTATIIVLILAGFFLILLEILTPFFGVVAAMAILAFATAIWLCFRISSTLGMVVMFSLLAVVPVYSVWLVRVLPRTRLGRRLFLGQAPGAAGEGTPEAARHKELVGRTAVAETVLRPSGIIRVDGQRVVALSEEGMIEKGSAVEIVRAAGANVIVRLKTAGPAAGAEAAEGGESKM